MQNVGFFFKPGRYFGGGGHIPSALTPDPPSTATSPEGPSKSEALVMGYINTKGRKTPVVREEEKCCVKDMSSSVKSQQGFY